MALIANYYDNVLSFLEAHHDGEEELVFPLLRERCAGEVPLLDRMAAQHHEAIALLAEARASLSAWQAGDPASQRAAEDCPRGAARAARHPPRRGGDGHAAHRRGQPFRRGMGLLPGHGMANFHGDKIWLILGLIRERMTEANRAAMLEGMPPPAVEMWTGFGEQAFRDYSEVVVVEVIAR